MAAVSGREVTGVLGVSRTVLRATRVFGAVAFSRSVAAIGFILISVVAARMLPLAENAAFIASLSLVLGLAVLSRYGRDNALLRHAAILWDSGSRAEFLALVHRAVLQTALAGIALTVGCGVAIIAQNRGLIHIPGLSGPVDVWLIAALPQLAAVQIYAAAFKAVHRGGTGSMLEVGGVCFAASVCLIGLKPWLPHSAMVFSVVVGIQALLICILAHVALSRMARVGSGAMPDRSVPSAVALDFANARGPLFLTAASYYLMQWGINLVVAARGDAHSITEFNGAMRLTSLVPATLLVVNTVIAPRLAIFAQRGERKQLERTILTSNFVTSAMGLPVLLVLLAFPGFVLQHLFKFHSATGSVVMQLLVLGQTVNLFAGPVMMTLAMTGFEQRLRTAYITCASATVLLAAAVPSSWGTIGIAAAVALGIALLNLWLSLIVRDGLGISVLLLRPRWIPTMSEHPQ